MSWAPQVIADRDGKFVGNGLRFATRKEALANVNDLASRWFAVTKTRVVRSTDPVNYSYTNGALVPVAAPTEGPTDATAALPGGGSEVLQHDTATLRGVDQSEGGARSSAGHLLVRPARD